MDWGPALAQRGGLFMFDKSLLSSAELATLAHFPMSFKECEELERVNSKMKLPPATSRNGSSFAKVKSASNVGSIATLMLMLNLSPSIQFPGLK